jgi:hypothetical protein
MRAAPSVAYPIGRWRWWDSALFLFWLLLAAAALAWGLQSDVTPWRIAGMSGAVVLAGWIVWRDGRRMPGDGRLRWDGAHWWVRMTPGDDEALLAAPPRVGLGASRWLLLGWREASGGPLRWAFALEAAQPARWRDLRRAVYSARPEITEASPEPG